MLNSLKLVHLKRERPHLQTIPYYPEQLAVNNTNLAYLDRYFKNTEEKGGARKGETFNYEAKTFGPAGRTATNQRFSYIKYGEVLNSAGDKASVFDRNMKDIFDIQDEITMEIVDKLRIKIFGTEKEMVAKRYTDNPEAYNLLLKARYFWGKRTREGFEKGISFRCHHT